MQVRFEIDRFEMCIRMIEAITGQKRPIGFTAKAAFANSDPKLGMMVQRAAAAAIAYSAECIKLAEDVVVPGEEPLAPETKPGIGHNGGPPIAEWENAAVNDDTTKVEPEAPKETIQ